MIFFKVKSIARGGCFMVKKHAVPIVIALLIGVALFTSYSYILTVKEKYEVLKNLEQIKTQLSQLENEKIALTQKLDLQMQEKQKILQEKRTAEETLRINQEKFSSVEGQLQKAQKTIEELNSSLAALQQEKVSLQQNQERLTAQVEEVMKAKIALEARFRSVKELKKAVRELRLQISKVKTHLIKKIENKEIEEGNRGYLTKDGNPTYPAKIKIEVTPAP
jgi:chromosome segregation ATPase